MATLIGKPPLAIDVEVLKKGREDLITTFDRTRGRDHLAELLTAAGFGEGRWLFRIIDPYRTRGKTQPLQVRRADRDGVHIWMRYGDNNSGVRGVLVVTKDKGLSAEDVYQRLTAVAHAGAALGNGHGGGTLPRPLILPDDLVLALLAAANELSGTHWSDLDIFLNALHNQILGRVETASDLLELLETLVDQELMSDHKTSYAPSLNGQTRLNAAVLPAEIPPAVVAATPLGAAFPGASNSDIVSLIEKNMLRLQQLIDLPKLAAASRARQRQLEAEIRKETADFQVRIQKKTAELHAEIAKEQDLLKTCDVDAVRLLLE